MLTACSSENDVLQEATQPQQTVVNRAVGFDIYTPAATGVTRAGLVGTMTTTRMQLSEGEGGGFGVYAYLTEDAKTGAGTAAANADGYTPTAGQDPNFMFNEKVLWNSDNLGWYYSPLKYWPNETDNDSQGAEMEQIGTTPSEKHHLDRLTFFAYAPYVSAGAGATGITKISDKTGTLNTTDDVTDPTIAWVASENPKTDFNPNQGVDLLWGVAPAGGLSYTAVNGTTVTKKEGTPLIDMVKPDVNTSMKLLFNHALARFGVTVVAAIDQVSPGGELDPNTKITINSLKIKGRFGTGGELNLNNGENANIANWTKITGGDSDEPISSSTANLSNDKYIIVSGQIADNLKFIGTHTAYGYSEQTVVGVTSAKQDVLKPSTKWFNKLAAAPTYNPGKKYYTDEGTTQAHATLAVDSKAQIDGKWGFFYTKDGSGVYAKQSVADDTPDYPNLPSTAFYFVKATEYTIATNATAPEGISGKVYKLSSGTYAAADKADAPVYLHNSDYSGGNWSAAVAGDKVYTLEAVQVPYTKLPYEYAPASPSLSYYEAERNYLYVVPTNNVSKNTAAVANEKDLRTIEVQIEYYITTEDGKVKGDRTQTKNVITKEVVLPSLANSKSYNLNLVLGLTSVKIEAEVDDWKVVNSQVDLPQNTAE